ncbi:MAG: HIT family protein [Gaiellaceae bacterium]
MAAAAPCVFCEIAAGREPASVVCEDDLVMAFMDRAPATEGYVIAIPKAHVPRLDDLDEDTGARLFTTVLRVQSVLRAVLRCDGINLLAFDGEAAGQEIPHTHLHVVPRYVGDSVEWLECEVLEPRREELDGLAASLRRGYEERYPV